VSAWSRPLQLAFPLAKRARYRVRQFLRGLRPGLAPEEIAEVRERLSEREFALFLAAEPRDRRHSVDLYRILQSEGVKGAPPSDALLTAALLHDVGKGPLSVWDRVIFVLIGGLPGSLAGWAGPVGERSRGGGARWRDAQWRLQHHAELGAELLERAGSHPRVVELTRWHTGPPSAANEELAAFIRADDRT